MFQLMAAAGLFIAIHLLVSGTSLRGVLVGAIGEKAYAGLFSLTSLGAVVWMAMSFNEAVVSAENVIYWQAPIGLLHGGTLIILIAALFVVIGLTTPGPTVAGAESTLETDDPASLVKGIQHITRHPFLWGVVIWSLFHAGVNGDRASQIFFGTFALVAFLGTFSIDAKRRRAFGDKWDAFANVSSNIPFAAVLTGRTSLGLREIGLWRPLAAIAVWAALVFTHEWLFGVTPFPV